MRPLSTREKFLLCVLLVVAVVSAYFALFYQPITLKMADLDTQIGETEDALLESQIKVSQQEKMVAELERLRAEEKNLISIAPYDNLQAVIIELNGILAQTNEYSLDFGTVDTSQVIVRRNIILNFTTGSYDSAKSVLRQLSDSRYRCLLSALSINQDWRGGQVHVSVNMTFFEYQENMPGEAATDDTGTSDVQ